MLQPRRVPRSGETSSVAALATALNNLALCPRHASSSMIRALPTNRISVRHASHAAQGRANGPGDSAGRRLGAKKTASEYVIPGNIIFKQRGTKWFPGENVGMGKDHTIYANAYGYVRYYRNPAVHPKRRYIGVALDREGPRSKLPTPPNAPARRRLGMYATPIKPDPSSPSTSRLSESEANQFLEAHVSTNSKTSSSAPAGASPPAPVPVPVTMRAGTYRMANFEIGRAAERKGVQVKEFDRGDRWLAWRKRAAKVKVKMMARASKATRKTKGKKSNKKVGKAGL